MVLPLLEIVLRATLQTGISGSNSFVQHMTLVIGMLGGAVAARENRLLGLSTGSAFLKGRLKIRCSIVQRCGCGDHQPVPWGGELSVCADRERSRQHSGVQLASVADSMCDAARLWPRGRASPLLRWGDLEGPSCWPQSLTGFLILLALRLPVPPAEMVTPALIGLLAATALGSPVFATLGGAALILFWGADLPIASIPLDHYRLVINPSLPTIPLFTLAGYFLAEGGASQRLVRVFQALFGQFRGGPAIVTALVCAFFTSFTGSFGRDHSGFGWTADAHIADRRLST